MQIRFFCDFLHSRLPVHLVRLDDNVGLNVSDLTEAVYKKYETKFKKANVDQSDLTFFALPTPLFVQPLGTLAQRATSVWIEDNIVSPEELLSEHLEWQKKDHAGLFLQVETEESKDKVADLANFIHTRRNYLEHHCEKSPSVEGEPSAFKSRQEDSDEAIYCGRPGHRVQAIPPTLLCPQFSQFVVDLDSCKPFTSDIECFHKLSQSMPAIFNNEAQRMKEFRKILTEHGFQNVEPLTIGKYTTDGGTRVFVSQIKMPVAYFIIEGKNEIGKGGAEPMFQGILYWMQLIREVVVNIDKSQQKNTNFPVVMLHHYGPYISVAVGVFADSPNVEILDPVIPLHFHQTNSKARATGERFICALRLLLSRLEDYYTEHAFSGYRDLQPQFPFRSTYTIKDVDYAFVYDAQLTGKRIFAAHHKDNPEDRVYVKFTRRYGEDAHRAASDLNYAPKLRAIERFNGWIMVVMDDVSRDYNTLLNVQLTKDLHVAADKALKAMHKKGFVHGDVRKANIMIRRDGDPGGAGGILFVDFDWAGEEGSVIYPSNINLTDLWHPNGVVRGGPIHATHDKGMLGYIFSKY